MHCRKVVFANRHRGLGRIADLETAGTACLSTLLPKAQAARKAVYLVPADVLSV